MKKGIIFILVLMFTVSWAYGDYTLNTVIDGGNPGGLNGDSDTSTTDWVEVAPPAQAVNVWSAVHTLPADFSFLFYNEPVTELKISQNGLITFDVAAADPPPDVNVNLPDATVPDKTIVAFWDEFTLSPPTGSNDRVFTKTFGTAPNRQIWFKYHSFEYSGYSYAYFGFCLEETTNRVYIVDYNYRSGTGAATIGLQYDATTAIEQPDSPNFAFLAGGSSNSDNDYYEFIPLIAGAPGYPENPVPASGSTGIAAAGDLMWDFGVDTDTYDLWFGPAGAMTEVVTGGTAGATGSYAYSGLAFATNYEWQVICHNAAADLTTNGSVWNFTVMNNPVFAQVGDGVTTGMSLPIEPYYGYSWSNSIYLASEVMTGGDITGIQYQYQSNAGFGPDDIIVYIGHTTQTEFIDGDDWIDVTTMTEVYNGPFSVAAATGDWVGITFPVPFAYNGTDNLVIGFDENTQGYHSSSDEFWCTDTTPIRGICYYSDGTNPDPFATLPTANAVRNAFPNVRLNGLVQPNGTLSGYVYEFGTTNPIENAEVECGGETDLTDATGYYEIPGILVGIYDATASYTGYVSETVSVEIFDGVVTTQDFGLGWAEILVSPTSFTVYLDPDVTTDEFLTITNNGTADLDYDCGLNFISDYVYEPVITKRTTPVNLAYNENDEMQSEREIPAINSDALFDLQFQYATGVSTGEAGVETDGLFIYTPLWNGTDYCRYAMDGTFIETFTVTGTSGVRDLAWDGTYFYGAAANTSLYQMDFTQGAEVLVSTITAPVACRAIAYDPTINGFWANNWSTDITQFDMTGTVITSFPCQTAISFYGFAYDDFLAGGPYLWGFSQSPANTLVQFDIATGLETGVFFDVGALVGSPAGSAGGMFISDACVPGTATLGCMIQNEWIVGLELCVTETWLTLTNNASGVVPPGGFLDVTVHFDATGYTAGEVKTGEIIVNSNAVTGQEIVPATLTITGGAYPIPFAEGFEGTFPPADWTLDTAGAGWIQSASGNGYTGDYAAMHNDDMGAQDDWLITPAVDLTAATAPGLTFWQYDYYASYYVEHNVCVSTDMATWDVVYTGVAATTYEEIAVDLTAYAGQTIYVGFQYIGDYADRWYVDDVSIAEVVPPLPFVEGFEGTFPPADWTLVTTGAGWIQSASGTGYTGDFAAMHNDDMGAQDDWLITPVIDLTTATAPELTFWQYDYYASYYVEHNVCVSTDMATWDVVYTGVAATTYEEIIIDLSSYAGQWIYVGFQYIGDYADRWYVDDVTIDEAPVPEPPNVFFSEYIEGSSYNKALEIYNGTGATINLDDFQLWQISNGGTWYEYSIDFPVGATLDAGDVWVVCHTDADPVMLAVADQILTLYHNGDDAQGLAWDNGTDTFVLIDEIGEEGDDPGSGWDVAGVVDGTKDHTLVRKDDVTSGNTDWTASAGTDPTDSEWIVYPQNTFAYLGWHIIDPEPNEPPQNLTATVLNQVDVFLDWDAPAGGGGLLSHHSGYIDNGIGTGAAASWICAARFDATDLAAYYGTNLTDLRVHIRTADFSYVEAQVYEGGSFGDPGTLIYAQDITTSVLIEDWTNHVLTTPIPLVAGNEYWIGYYMDATGDHPASVDAGPAVPGKGDWMYYSGAWLEISTGFGLDYNWCIEGIVGPSDNILAKTKINSEPVPYKAPRMKHTFSQAQLEAEFNHPQKKGNTNISVRESRELLGYNVYRDGVGINAALVTDTEYLDIGLADGTYQYWITAVYFDGESIPSNTEEVTISTVVTVTDDYPLPDSPEQIAYPNNPNPYSNTLTDFGWTTVDATVGGTIYGWEMVLDWESIDYPTEGSFWVESPGGTETIVNIYNPTAVGLVPGLVLTTDVFNGEDCLGLWNIWIEDSYGDGGHRVTNAIMSITHDVTTVLNPPQNLFVDDSGYATWDAPGGGGIYTDDLEAYTVGGYLAVQSADWTTWSNAPGTGEDALISDVQALSGSNSVVVEGTSDLVLIMDNYTSGVYSMELNLYVPTGNSGYWNLQKTNTIGQEWAFQILFETDGIATADAGAAAALTFPFNFDTWINMELIIDLDTDWCEIWVDGVMLYEYQWTLGTFGTPGLLSLGGMNLYASGGSPMCYFDDFTFSEITSDEIVAKTSVDTKLNATENRDLLGYNIYLGGVFDGFTADLFYQYIGLVNGQTYMAGVTALYDEGESTIVEFEFTYIESVLNPPQNLFVDDTGYSTWDAPGGGGATVDFTIDLTDDYGDGWNGGMLDVAVNGTVVLDDITVAAGYGPDTFIFSVANGDLVEIYYTEGGWGYENAYYVYDNTGTLVVSSGDGGVTPDVYVFFNAVVADDHLVRAPKVDPRTKLSGQETRDLLGYNVYLDGAFVDFTADEFYQYIGLVDGQTYMAGVTAVYDEGESAMINFEFTYIESVFDPPQNLFVDNFGYATWDAPGGGGTIGLYSQWDFVSAEGGVSAQDFEAAFDIYDAEGADEFVVPTGETWTINEVAVLGSYSTTGPCDLANVRFYEDAAGMPGTLLFEYLDVVANPDVDGNLDCFIPDTPFTAGTYWVSVQGDMEFGTCGQWYWERQAAPTIGYEFHWQNPGGGFGGLTTWGPGSVQWPGQFDYNLSFALFGTLTDEMGKPYVKSNPNPNENIVTKTKAVNNRIQSRIPTIDHMVANSNSDVLTGYNVYIDGAFVDYTTDEFWQYTGLNPEDVYLAQVTAVYDDPGESDPIDYEFLYSPITLDPPTDLFVDNLGYATWVAPGGGGTAQDILFDDFEAGIGNWTVVNNGVAGDGVWTIYGEPYPNGYQMPATSFGNVCAADADEVYPIDSELINTVPFDLSTFTEVYLEWDNDWNSISADDWAYVDVSNDFGGTWNNVLTWGDDVRNTHEVWDISAFAAGSDGVLVRFHSVQPGWDWYWVLDNVYLHGITSGGGSGTVQVDPMAVPYWTGTTDGSTMTFDSLVNGWDADDGWMMFDVSGIPDGSTITNIEFNGYVNATNWPYWDLNGVDVDPLTASPADLYAAIQTNTYNAYMEPSTFPTGWKVDILGGTANADLAAALANDWFCLGINSTDNSANYYIVFDGWNEALPPFLIVDYEGTDGIVARTKVKAVTNDDTRDLLGYNVYLEGVFEAFTEETFHQHDTAVLTPGDPYITAVEAVYDEGISVQIDYTWTYIPGGNPQIVVDPTFIYEILDPDEIVVVPLNIENTGSGDLTFDITVVETSDALGRSRRPATTRTTPANHDPSNNEKDPDWKKVDHPNATDDLFDFQFDWPVGVGGGEAGIETDGNYIYTTKWNGAVFYRYDMDGTYIEEFSVPGAASVRDLAYDGQYFYGAAASTTVFEMDFDSQTLISTINAPVAVRAIAYDEVADGFWGNNWSDQITLFDRNGTTLDSFPCGVFQSYYGFAWENQLADGPFLWGYAQDGPSSNQLVQFDIATGLETGVNFDIGSIMAVGTGIAGGMCISDAFVPGTWTICGTSQNVNIWGVELAPGEDPWISVDPLTGTVPAGTSVWVDVTLNATDLINVTKTADIIIANNAGDDVIVPVTMEVIDPVNPFNPPENVQVDPYTAIVTWEPPGGTIYGDDFEAYTVGGYLAVQSDDWTTWSNNPGSGEDAFISDDYALSGTNSVKVDGTTDLVLIMENYTTGAYSIDLNMYIPAGYCAYYNLQKTNVPGTEWGFQIMFDVDGIASIDGGAAAACTFPFDFDTWMNFEIVVDLDNDLCDFYYDSTLMHSYQWTLGTFGTPGLNQLGGVNMYAWASAGNNPLYYFDDVTFGLADAEPSDELTGYNVYLDGLNPVFTTDLTYQYTGLTYGQAYVAGVSAVYDDPGESDIVEVPFVFTPSDPLPPENLVATVFDYNDVHLEWEQPSGTTGGILAYHTGYDLNGIGTGAAADFMCAARFTADELAEYYGSDLTAVNVHIRTADFSYVAVKVWEGGSFGNPGTEIYSADVTGSVLIEDWTEHILTTPIPLVSGNEYWIGYDMSATGDHPASVDAGPAAAGKGDWMYYSGIWQEISVAFALDYNWCIEGVVGGGDDILMTSRVTKNNHTPRLRNMMSSGIPAALTVHPRTKGIENNRDSRMLMGYKVYRDGTEIAEILDPNELTYDDMGLDGGTYEYWVTAIYDDVGESDPSNVEEVIIVLNPPQNLQAVVQGMNNVFLSWDEPATRDLASYNIYRNGDVIGNITSTFYLDVGLAAGTYSYYVTAVYDVGWESDFSNEAIATVDVGGIPLPLVTELNGNYPNPFNPDTRIKFSVHEAGNVRIDIFNSKGQKIRTLVNEYLSANFYNMVWDGKDTSGYNVSSGVYFYKMDAGKYTSTKKMILMK